MTLPTKMITGRQYRVCGESAARGHWSGSWHREPAEGLSGSAKYEIDQLAKRNDRVWIERRTVTYSDFSMEEVERAS